MKMCSVDECSLQIAHLEYCNKHYVKYKKYGDPLAGKFESVNKQGTREYILENTKAISIIDVTGVYKKVVGPCWVWQRYIDSWGYGALFHKGKRMGAHKLSFITHGGILSEENPLVLHKCDNPPCCNPNHLYAGNNKKNARDRVARGRMPSASGENNPKAKLKKDEVVEIKRLLVCGLHKKDIAYMFNVSECTIRDIEKKRTWNE